MQGEHERTVFTPAIMLRQAYLTIQPIQARARNSMNRSPDTNEANEIK
jgi:hypothetical protein